VSSDEMEQEREQRVDEGEKEERRKERMEGEREGGGQTTWDLEDPRLTFTLEFKLLPPSVARQQSRGKITVECSFPSSSSCRPSPLLDAHHFIQPFVSLFHV